MINEIDKRIGRAMARIRQAFRGVGTRVNSTAPVQLVQGEALAGEQLQDNELMQHYGYTSNPPAGFMYVAVPVGGKTAHGIMIATEHGSYRLKGLQSGEVALYTDEGDKIVMKRGRLIEVTTQTLRVNAGVAIELNAPLITGNASTKVAFNTPLVAATGNLEVDEDITDRKAHPDVNTVRGMRDLYDTHTHHENDALGETNAPTQQT